MKSSSLVLSAALISPAFSHWILNPSSLKTSPNIVPNVPRGPHAPRGCQVSDAVAIQSPSSLLRRQNTSYPDSITVPVHFHIASTEADFTSNLITPSIIAAQFSVLATNFAAQNIILTHASTSHAVSNLTGSAFLIDEREPGSPYYNFVYHAAEHLAYLKSTRQGDYTALNLYFYSSYSPSATGVCQFPALEPVGDTEFWTDSCQIAAATMPGIVMPEGRAFDEWNQGHIAVHEAGHWFGLNHTFAGGCGGEGDFVSDTPATGQIYDCPVGSDTCPDSAGLDPIHNFMGYTNDSCTSEFTPGQKARMLESFFSYRKRKTV